MEIGFVEKRNMVRSLEILFMVFILVEWKKTKIVPKWWGLAGVPGFARCERSEHHIK